jgi:LuxR family transcriptional regulator, maltose regulon positive regulatory protein
VRENSSRRSAIVQHLLLLPATTTADGILGRHGAGDARRPGRVRTSARPLREGFVRRPELVQRLVGASDAVLALITAPAGYGKSTLLAEWAECDDRPFGWIALDPCDDTRAAVTSAIARTLENMGWVDPDAWSALMGSTAGDGTSALRRMIRELAHRDHGFVLVIDDAHKVAGTALWAVVTAVLGQLGTGSALAVASRSKPPLPIGRLRAHRALVEVRAEDLAMTPVQAAALLRLAGLELEFGSVQALSKQTEGWPAGLYMAALSLRGECDVGAALKQFSGGDHVVAEYFRDEFLAALTNDRARFLTRSSVLDDLSGPLCDAVLQQSATAVALDEIARSNLMLVPLDRNHERFRLHGLFKATLRAELRRTEPDLEPRLHRRASAWLERHGDLDGAIGHAVAAGDLGRTGDLLWPNIVGFVSQGHNQTVQDWLGAFSSAQIGACAPLALAAAHSWLMTGHVDRARHFRLAAAAARERDGAGEMPSLQAGEAIFDAMAAPASAADMMRAATRAFELEPEHGPWRPYCYLFGGVAEHLIGEHRSASGKLEHGMALSLANAPSVASLCLAQLAMIAIEQEDWTAAVELAERAQRTVDRAGLGDSPISALVFAASAATLAHGGRIDEAKRDLRRATDLLTELGDFISWYGAEARIMLARAALGLADTVKARTLLAEASRLGRRTPDAVIFKRCFEQAWAHIDTLAETALSGPSSLTIAELRILRFLPSHHSFRQIAERLDVSVNTVKTQAHAIYRKLDAASRSEAVAQASRAGLLAS